MTPRTDQTSVAVAKVVPDKSGKEHGHQGKKGNRKEPPRGKLRVIGGENQIVGLCGSR
jgi:hypothetical protein